MVCLIGLTDNAKRWIKRHLVYDEYQSIADGVLVDQHCIDDIIDGMKSSRLKYGVDFEVC